MTSQSFENRMQQAIANGEISGAVLAAENREGTFRYEKAFGYRSLKDPSNPDLMKVDAVMWMASCTKFPTTIAAMQCVERGLLKLDSAVYEILPELKGLKILTGFEENNGKEDPVLVENTKAITLRHLLTHSSGLTYDFFNPLMTKYRNWQKRTPPDLNITSNMRDAFLFPLVFAPGESWEYGVGIDWAGWMVERVTNTSLEAYLQRNIWDVLGVKGFSFFPQTKPDLMARMTDMCDREGGLTMFGTAADPEGKIVHRQGKELWNSSSTESAGGAGSYGAPLDYQVMLHSILTDDGKLLKPATTEEMFTPQLTDASRSTLMEMLKLPEVNNTFGGLPIGTKCDWGLGGMINLHDIPGRRKKGAMAWGGYPNLIWFIDRAGGISGIYGSQLNPPGDPKTVELFGEWEKELYRKGRELKL
ncbi:related to transesterase [Rhynchosporium agropyri]|uniref:Related to transesterase n=1 Tax=Rhynchosporium agropyri TaxID=914238 RepID=A0A1E1LDL4_9HELO|nr:related to transesterase [Rhynchosporium agropyri]